MFSILSIVKIEWKPEDVVLLKRSKKDIKNVDHMMINRDIATVREFMFCKVRVWKGYFCNWLRKNWPTLASSPHLTTFPQLNMSRLKSCPPLPAPPPYTKRRGGRELRSSDHELLLAKVKFNVCLIQFKSSSILNKTLSRQYFPQKTR